ncbi:MAG: hypothetical protein GW748_00945 [Alphaproteobacteria bacterium]|nr:hypothetical protein [Alphaproteobacteria bacterium]NCQ66300.1 hypothetical protein [Alphaproteobacteria bacterium]NCT06786.1 hypothetical protein [Alphaproteobacteria bacterium]
MIKSSLQYITLLTVAALISVTGAFAEPPVAHSTPPATINEKDENENYLWEPYSIPEDEEMRSGKSREDWALQKMTFQPDIFYYHRETKTLWKQRALPSFSMTKPANRSSHRVPVKTDS